MTGVEGVCLFAVAPLPSEEVEDEEAECKDDYEVEGVVGGGAVGVEGLEDSLEEGLEGALHHYYYSQLRINHNCYDK